MRESFTKKVVDKSVISPVSLSLLFDTVRINARHSADACGNRVARGTLSKSYLRGTRSSRGNGRLSPRLMALEGISRVCCNRRYMHV